MARLFRDFELHGTASLPLPNPGPTERTAKGRDIFDPQAHEITSAQLAVDRQIEEGQVPNSPVELQAGPDGPKMLWLKRWLRADQLNSVPGLRMVCDAANVSMSLHDRSPKSLGSKEIDPHAKRPDGSYQDAARQKRLVSVQCRTSPRRYQCGNL